MAEIDELSISIKASTHEAVTSIDKLIQTLGKLSSALNISGVDGFVNSMERIAKTIDSINTENLDKLALSTKSLAKYTKNLSMVGTGAKQAGDSVSKLGKELAGDLGISDKNAISQLQKSLHEFFSSKDNQSMSKAHDNIMRIAQAYMRIDGKANEAKQSAVAFLDALKNRKLNLPKEWTKEYGDVGEGRRYRTMIGPLKQTVRSGGSDAEEVAKDLGINDYNNAQDAFQKIALRAAEARETIKQADNEMLSYAEALREGGSAANEANAALEMLMQKLANFVKMTPENMQKAMNPAYSTTPQKDLEEQRAALGQFSVMADHMQSIGNPFENVATGLRELSAIQISDTLANLNYLKDAVSKVGGESGMRAGAAMRDIASGLEALNVPVPPIGEELGSLAAGLRALGSGNVVTASQTLPFLAEGITQLNAVQLDPTKAETIGNLANAVKQFGYAKTENAIVNLPVLATELSKLINTLAKAPAVSNSTIELIKAIGNLNMKTGALAPATTRAAKGLNLFSNNAKKAHKPAFSLAAAIGKVYATYWALFRVMGMFKNSIDLASDLTEVQNVVDHTFGQMKDRMEYFAKSAVETVGMSELTAKQIASRFQSMGRNMGIPESAIKSTNDFVNSATNGYSGVADSMADVSINLTKLAGDMASFYNLPYEDVAEDMEAIFTGQTRPLRKYGLDLTQATLKEWALANGMNADIKSMTQAEKTLLRYQYVMANTTAAQGDFERTIGTWANQIKLAQENLKRLQIILGQIGINTFKPLVVNFNSAMNDIIHLAESTFNALGTIFGWHIEISDVGILDDMADGLEDVEDGYDAAGDSAKKFKNFLLGIDELNLLPDNSDKGKGSGDADALGALSNGLQDSMVNFEKTEGMFDSLYDTLFKLGARIGEVEKEWLKGIDWDGVYDKARDFAKGLADFLNGYFSDAELFYEKGKFIANGINTVANAIDEFFKQFNGWKFGVDIGSFINGFTENLDWPTIQSAAEKMAEDIAQTINGALLTTHWDGVGSTIAQALNTGIDFAETLGKEISWEGLGDAIANTINGLSKDFDAGKLASAINNWSSGITTALIKALDRVNWSRIGKKLGELVRKLNITELAAKLGEILIKVLEAAATVWSSALAEAPLETALITAIALIKPKTIGAVLSPILTKAFGFVDTKGISAALDGVLKTLPISLPQLTLGVGAGFTEFVSLKNTFKELYDGTENVVTGIGKIATTSVATGAIMTSVFGFPAGTAAVAIAGIAGAITGVIEGAVEANQKLENMWTANAIRVEGGVSAEKYFDNASQQLSIYAESYSEMAKKIEETDFDTAKQKVDSDMTEISNAIGKITDAMDKNIDELPGQMKQIVDMFAQFKTDVENVFSEEIDAVIEMGNSGLIQGAANAAAIGQGLQYEYVQKVEDLNNQARNLYEQVENGEKTYTEVSNQLISIQTELNKLQMKEVESVEDKISNINLTADFSSLMDQNNYEKALAYFEASLNDYKNTYDQYVSDIETVNDAYYNQLIEWAGRAERIGDFESQSRLSGLIASQLKKEEQDIEKAYTQYISNFQSYEDQAMAQISVIINKGFEDGLSNIEISDRVYDYIYNVYKPLMDTIAERSEELGFEFNVDVQEMCEGMMSDLDTALMDFAHYGGDYDFDGFMSGFTEKYREQLANAYKPLDEFKSMASNAAQEARNFADSVDHSFNVMSNAEYMDTYNRLINGMKGTSDIFGNVSKSASGASDNLLLVYRSMYHVNQNSPVIREGLARIKDEFDKTSQKADGMRKSLDTLTSSFGTTKEKINNAKTFDGVKKSTDEVVTGFDKIKSISSEVANALSISLGEMSGEFSTVFTNISSDTDVFINQFKGDLTNLFSADTWSGMLSGIPNTFRTMWDNTIKVMKTMWNDFAQWINNNATIEIPKTKVGNTEIGGANIRLKVPRFDVGGSIPNDGSLFVANERGAEVVANMGSRTGVMNTDQMEAAIANGMMRAMAASGQNVQVVLNGDAATFFTAMVKENNSSIMRTGSSPLRV